MLAPATAPEQMALQNVVPDALWQQQRARSCVWWRIVHYMEEAGMVSEGDLLIAKVKARANVRGRLDRQLLK